MPHFKFRTGIFSAIILCLLLCFSLYHQGSLFYALLALAVHEFTHILCCELLDYPVQELNLTLTGGRLKVDPAFTVNPQAESLIAAAGPLSNLLMAGGVLYLRLLGISHFWLDYWLQVNLLIGCVNLIPAAPLDGGRIIHAWLNKSMGLKNSNIVSRNLAALFGFLFLTTGLFRLFNNQAGIIYLIIGLFILIHLFFLRDPELNLVWKALQHKKKRLAKNGFLKIKPIFVDPATPLKIPLRYYGTADYLLFFSQDKAGKMSIITEDAAWNLLINQGYDVTFAELRKAQSNITCRILSDEVE